MDSMRLGDKGKLQNKMKIWDAGISVDDGFCDYLDCLTRAKQPIARDFSED